MGYMLHHAIVVTTWNEKAISRCAARARDFGLHVAEQVHPSVNGYRSILICPDGSKEGWPEKTA